MRRDDGAGIDHEIARTGRGIGIAGGDPDRVEPEGRVAHRLAVQLADRLAGIERQHLVGRDSVFADHDAANDDAIGEGGQVDVVADSDLRDDEAELLGELAAHPGDPPHQRPAAALVDQRHEAIADVEHHLHVVGDFVPADLRKIGRLGHGLGRRWAIGVRAQLPCGEPGSRRGGQDHPMRHAGHYAEQTEDDRDRRPGLMATELAADLAGEIVLRIDSGDDRGGGDRQHQRGQLCHQRVADREHDISLRGVAHRHLMADHAEDQAADDVDREDQEASDSIALHELGRTVHRAIEIGFGRHLDAPRPRLVGRHQPGVEIGVDRHLLAGQGIEGEARADFGDAARALGDDDHVDDHQHREHDDADDIVAADQEGAERLDDMAGRRAAFMPVDQNDARRGDVEAEPEQGGEQQHGRESGEIERLLRIERHHQHREADHDVHDEEHVEQKGRDRHDQQGDEQQNCAGKREAAERREDAGAEGQSVHWISPRASRASGTRASRSRASAGTDSIARRRLRSRRATP